MEFSDRVTRRLSALKISDTALCKHPLAKKVNLTKGNIQQYKKGPSMPSILKGIVLSQLLETTNEWLYFGIGLEDIKDMSESPLLLQNRAINTYPIINWSEVCEWSSSSMNKENQSLEQYNTSELASPGSFAAVVQSENMQPDINRGETILVDVGKTPVVNDFVIIRDGEKSIIRQYMTDGDIVLLKSTNPNWPNKIEVMCDGMAIIGCIIEVRRKLSNK